ncbi:MAG TPA: NAD(P)/FAD-dependent oxidoreductase [Beijerinckiaceae bacterium]|nr:NAD(P)/FAD-dependent oxidoreductase [Beijerinckiaceae bacterium]
MSEPDLVVIGAGPAGVEAALAASEAGVKTLIVDEAPRAGGQIYRALPETFIVRDESALGPDYGAGESLRARLAASSVQTAFGHRVWRIASGLSIEAASADGARKWQPRAILAATGAYERVVPFPGWTKPGVMGLAAATILIKSQQVLPGRKIAVAGCGPLLAAVAASILASGGEVAAVIDLASRGEWLKTLPALASRPHLLARGLRWAATIRTAGVPMFFGHTIARVEDEDDEITGIAIRPVGADGTPIAGTAERWIEADTLVVGHGLVPSTEISRVLRAKHVFRPERGGWIVKCDSGQRTSIPGLYACGDGTGISCAAAAALEGRLAGMTIALDLKLIDQGAYARAVREIDRELLPARRFGAAMAQLLALRPGLVAAIDPQTIVCRCEDVRRASVEDAIATGAFDLNQLKAWTRAGMGPCQGRLCGETIGTLASAHWGGRDVTGQWTGRLPLRPVPMAAIIGDYRYEDIVWGGNKAQIDDEGRPLKR